MKKIHAYTKIALPVLAAAILTATSGRADTYSWTNFQSDIPGVAQHVDPNLVNPWGMSVSPSGTIWVSDNGTGVSTLYHQDGTAVSLVVTIPTAARNRDVAILLDKSSMGQRSSKSQKMETRHPPFSFLSVK